MSTAAVLSPVDIPQNEQQEIIDLYRAALLRGSEAKLVSPTGKTLKLPSRVYELLVQILKDLSDGKSVAVFHDKQGLTTVQAAKLLGVSRQFLVNLLERGEMPFDKVGTHRRVMMKHVLAYKSKRDRKREEILKEMTESELEAGLYETLLNVESGQ